ncbi:MAG: peptidylprolyl isomerase [Gammaproteobacteria bacterium]|nr:peptidylprolyl isomerase [Gammaproteobacteria bacterium]
MVTFHTNHGAIKIELFTEQAPETCANFINYVRNGFYENTLFHRVIPNFMIQGGGFAPGMKQKPTQTSVRNEADNGIENEIGTLAMARTSDPHSATAQFFINVKSNDFLNYKASTPQGWGYCVFAKVIEGMDVVNKIVKVPTAQKNGHGDVPVDDVIIERVEYSEA